MKFPFNYIKGIPNNDFMVKEDCSIGSNLFYFNLENVRSDGWIEQSINWEDNDTVIDFTLAQEKADGTLQFKAGIAIFPRDEIDRLNRQPTLKGLLSYERQPLENNPFHGNILLKSGVPKLTMKKIAAGIALTVSEINLRNNGRILG
jgi:hypothetical protein